MRTSSSRRAFRRRVGLVAAAALLVPGLTVATAAATPATAPAASAPMQAAVAETPPSIVGDETGLTLHNSFVSAVGWVKPGAGYPFRLILRNAGVTQVDGVAVTVTAPPGTRFVSARDGGADVPVTSSRITWNPGTVARAADERTPTVRTLVVQAQSASLAQDPEIVWKDLSATATLDHDGLAAPLTSRGHGPKVIPPGEQYDTARYGDRPFPVVPVEYQDIKMDNRAAAVMLDDAINGRDNPGSTFNLFQEMSYGMLHPEGTVPSADLGTVSWTAEDDKTKFTRMEPQGSCTGVTRGDIPSSISGSRIANGIYQLPGTAEYYGRDKYGSGLVGAIAGVGAIFDIDGGCGPTAKSVYDAAVIADPDIDYSDYDTDKDGVVDFFMMVFAGCGGNGDSQLAGCPFDGPSYDNIWPHSSSLEFTYTDEATGLSGYISDDQLKDLEGRPLWYTDESRGQTTPEDKGDELKVLVRVGPYNVNPETSIDKASVISHEYGHSLGLPDFYSLGSRRTYGDWNLMATDKSQHMDVFSKQEMGWIVPRVLGPGETQATNWSDSKLDTERIDWVRPDGRPYTLSPGEGHQGIHNGEAYVAKLPGRQLLAPEALEETNGEFVWWSGSGNDFGCPPTKGHNLDIALGEALKDVPAGTELKATFSTRWDIEWDYDYGFVLSGLKQDNAVVYESNESENGYTTPASQNPNANACQGTYGNGITGTSGSYDHGTQEFDRIAGDYPEPVWLEDSYDISELVAPEGGAAEGAVLRFTYATDPGLARQGWFIDNLKITAGEEVVYERDFEEEGGPDDPSVFNGGCKDRISTASTCTAGWTYVQAGAEALADHAYYLEMRDRSGFDNAGRNENDRAAIAFEPGLLLTYTDEVHGYGNVGTDDPPAQSPLDSVPQPGNRGPNLNDAAFRAVDGRSAFTDASATPHIDNYRDPRREDNDKTANDETSRWVFDFNCLTFDVTRMSGDATMSDTVPGDLNGDVTFDIGAGCGQFDYGFGDAVPACPAGTVPDSGHTDANPPNAHALEIDCMVWWGIAKGRTASLYDVGSPATRAQMATFVAQLIEASGGTLPAGRDAFADDNGDRHEANINKLAAAGIVKGVGGGAYAPQASVGRDQMTTYLVNAYEYVSDQALTADADFFTDDEQSVHEDNINKAATAGFALGRGEGRFEPFASVRRDQMASFLSRVLNTLVGEGTTPPKTA